jgi:carboxypeptidase PM20D1
MESNEANASPVRSTVVRVTPGSVLQENGGTSNALAVVDVFLHPRDTAAAATEQVKAAIGDSDVDVRPVMQVEPSRTADINGPAYAHISRAIAETFRVPVAPELMTRPTDSRYYLDIADAVLRFRPFPAGPDDLARVHGADERIAISDLGPAVGFYTWLIRNSAQ